MCNEINPFKSKFTFGYANSVNADFSAALIKVLVGKKTMSQTFAVREKKTEGNHQKILDWQKKFDRNQIRTYKCGVIQFGDNPKTFLCGCT